MLDLVTLPLDDFSGGRKPGAPILVRRADGVLCSGVYLADDYDKNWCSVWVDGGLHVVALVSCELDLSVRAGADIAMRYLHPEAIDWRGTAAGWRLILRDGSMLLNGPETWEWHDVPDTGLADLLALRAVVLATVSA